MMRRASGKSLCAPQSFFRTQLRTITALTSSWQPRTVHLSCAVAHRGSGSSTKWHVRFSPTSAAPSRWSQQGFKSTVLFDGLDPRGALRGRGEPRVPQIFGSDDHFATLFARDRPIGEGDLKLAWVQQRVRDLVARGTLQTQLNLTVTIDTDSIAIELMEHARRACVSDEHEQDAVMGALCMRERSHTRDAYDNETSAAYFVVDYARLFRAVQREMWSLARDVPSPKQQRLATVLLCAGWALAGCDFVSLTGLKADMVLDAMPSLLHTAPGMVDLMENSWSGDREAAKLVLPALRRLVLLCAGNYGDTPRARKTTVEAMRNHDTELLLRAAWVASYWSNCEFAGSLQDFGFYVHDAPVASADMLQSPTRTRSDVGPSRFFSHAERARGGDTCHDAHALEQFACSHIR